MYFRLQQLHKAPFSDYDKSITVLNGLAGSDYTDQINTLFTTVKTKTLMNPGQMLENQDSSQNTFGSLHWHPASTSLPYVGCPTQ